MRFCTNILFVFIKTLSTFNRENWSVTVNELQSGKQCSSSLYIARTDKTQGTSEDREKKRHTERGRGGVGKNEQINEGKYDKNEPSHHKQMNV